MTKAFRRLVRPLLLIVCFVMAVSFAIPTRVVQAAGYPSLTYIRFNRSGGSISATYCIAADSYQLYWGESSPSYWYSYAFVVNVVLCCGSIAARCGGLCAHIFHTETCCGRLCAVCAGARFVAMRL
ncbi:hypothetical protein F8S13_18165 [Chloroflexia bacterium SDU3-3]|nr:hypothetical protein F8S13_18165 [Chloroflexia bacterium SDU3-3]